MGEDNISRLRDRLDAGEFAITAELGPPRGAQTKAVRDRAAALNGWVDAINITDNQSSFVRLASWAGSLVVMDEGVDPVMQVACRDRNRIALQSDVMSAAAMGIGNVLVLTGDDPKYGDHKDAKAVFDLDSTQLLQAVRTMRDEARLMSGEELKPAPDLLIGAVENPVPSSAGYGAGRLAKKVDAGAEFVQTQFVFDVAEFAEWMGEVRDLGLDERCHILAGVGPIRSLRAIERMREIPGMRIPDEVEHRLAGVPEDKVAEEGRRLCTEIIQQIREVPGAAGVHVMAIAQEAAIPDILADAGFTQRR